MFKSTNPRYPASPSMHLFLHVQGSESLRDHRTGHFPSLTLFPAWFLPLFISETIVVS